MGKACKKAHITLKTLEKVFLESGVGRFIKNEPL